MMKTYMMIEITTEDTIMTIADKALKAAFREIELLKMKQEELKESEKNDTV